MVDTLKDAVTRFVDTAADHGDSLDEMVALAHDLVGAKLQAAEDRHAGMESLKAETTRLREALGRVCMADSLEDARLVARLGLEENAQGGNVSLYLTPLERKVLGRFLGMGIGELDGLAEDEEMKVARYFWRVLGGKGPV